MSPADAEFRKAVEAIALRPQSGRLTLLTRKLFNILLYHAQRQGVDLASYRTRLAEIIINADFDSRDTQLVKDHLAKIQDLRVEWNDPGRSWEREPMLSRLRLEKVEGQVWLEWSYPPRIRATLLAPNVYTRLSLYVQAMLRTSAGLALYEVAKRYATNPGGTTLREDWRWWYHVLTGNPELDASLQYKYFKRDTLKPAIAEVNQVSDLTVDVVEHKVGRRIEQLQFAVTMKPQTQLELEPPRVIDTALFERLLRFGLDPCLAGEIYAEHDRGFLSATLELVEARRRNTKLPALDSPVAFFKTALRNKYALTAAPIPTKPPPPQPDPKQRLDKVRIAFMDKRRSEARAFFAELDSGVQAGYFDAFRTQLGAGGLATEAAQRGLASKQVEVAFSTWLAIKQWGEPSAEDLLLVTLPEQ